MKGYGASNMRWYEAYWIVDSGGMVRRESWNESEYIMLKIDEGNEDVYLINNNGGYCEMKQEDLMANDWIEHEQPNKILIDDMTDKEYLSYVQTKSLSVVQNQVRILSLRFRSFAEKHNAIPKWNYDDNLKYYIVYSYTGGNYFIEGTWGHYYPNIVYFTKKEVAEKCMVVYKPMMDTLRHVEGIRGILFNDEELSRNEIQAYDTMLDTL